MNFLPEDYEAPKSSSYYLKLQEGENRVRILSRPILGWEDWEDNKPVRYRMDNKPLQSVDPKKPVRHFWAFIVYNYNEEQIQVMHVTQATIRKSLEALCRDKDWGSPFLYDIKIVKKGEKVDTEYTVNPVPHKPVDEHILNMFFDRRCNLNALFENLDPFSKEWKDYTPLALDPDQAAQIEDTKSNKPGVHVKEISELKSMFEECDPAYKEQLLKTLSKLPTPIHSIEDVPISIFSKIKEAVRKKRDEYQQIVQDSKELFAVV